MSKKFMQVIALLLCIALWISSCKKDFPKFCNCNQNDLLVTHSVYAKGLNSPRGLKFGPDGNLYVAEGGVGGTNSTVGQCEQVPGGPAGPGPETGSPTGSDIVKISNNGHVSIVADNLPSSQTSPGAGGDVEGVADVAFINNTLYAVLAGAGCSHGVPSIPNGIIKVLSNKWKMVANLSNFQMNNPVANPNPLDFEPDGTWYSMLSLGNDLYAVEPNHGEIDKIDLNGNISRVVDISASQGHIVPTSIVYHNGNFYFGNLDVFPLSNKSNVYKLDQNGMISILASGFSMITGIAFDKAGGLYVLESTTNNLFPTPNSGDVVRIDQSGARVTILTGLSLPTAMTFGPDDNLYISHWGYGAAPGGGEIWKVNITCPSRYSKGTKNN